VFPLTEKSSPAFVVLNNKEKAARTCLVRQRTPTQCVRDDFLGETSLNAVLHWFLGGSTRWLSTGSAGDPRKRFFPTLVLVANCKTEHPTSRVQARFLNSPPISSENSCVKNKKPLPKPLHTAEFHVTVSRASWVIRSLAALASSLDSPDA
jgi:hypothetical protein